MARNARKRALGRNRAEPLLCDTCGNELSSAVKECIYCGARLEISNHARPRGRTEAEVTDLNIKHGMPTGDQAIVRLDSGLARARASGSRVIRVVHGYGSSGTGGVIRERVRQHLAAMLARGAIAQFVQGEEFAISTEAGDQMLRACPALRAQLSQDRCNPGITMVML